ncbi:MAG: Undecaprenyl-phosphate glucose phosphotransferase, partial [Mucilaginibacter sp.]|nr:Undecaprenyl-phosphate glucose phosphotransferase [Mucilaginibacter sp.]
VNLCFFLGYYLTDHYFVSIDKNLYFHNIALCNLIWVICSGFFRLYTQQIIRKEELIYKATWKSVALHTCLFVMYLFASNYGDFSKYFLIIFYSLLILSFILSRFTGTAFQAILNKKFDVRTAVAILGMNQGGLKLAEYLGKQSSLNFVGFLGEGSTSVNEAGELIFPSTADQFRAASNSGIDEVFVCIDTDKMSHLPELIKEGEKQCIRLSFVPDFTALQTNLRFDQRGEFMVLCARNEPLEKIDCRLRKRLFDIVVSSLVIVFILSWLYVVLAIIIKMQSRGPVLFKQLRSGKDNKPFWCYKFRSMRMNDQSELRQASIDDDRITPIGRFMRRTSLDEFPQFFNVLFGYMSILGPRPHMLSHTEQYRQIIDKYMIRHFLKPGISGWAQINGYRGETKNALLMEKRVEHDIWYMENWSLMLDVKIMFLTIINVFRGEKNAY